MAIDPDTPEAIDLMAQMALPGILEHRREHPDDCYAVGYLGTPVGDRLVGLLGPDKVAPDDDFVWIALDPDQVRSWLGQDPVRAAQVEEWLSLPGLHIFGIWGLTPRFIRVEAQADVPPRYELTLGQGKTLSSFLALKGDRK